MSLTAIELSAGGGGQALGLEMAGFHHAAAVEYEPLYCTTLRKNRPQWNVVQQDIRNFRSADYSGIDLLAGGVPCPPFSIAGKQLGSDDERDMFPAALAIVEAVRPRAVLFENVRGLASAAESTKTGSSPSIPSMPRSDLASSRWRSRDWTVSSLAYPMPSSLSPN